MIFLPNYAFDLNWNSTMDHIVNVVLQTPMDCQFILIILVWIALDPFHFFCPNVKENNESDIIIGIQ